MKLKEARVLKRSSDSTAMGAFRVVIYALIFGVWGGSLAYDVLYMPRIGSEWWISKLVMLTMINFVLQTVYSAVCFCCSLMDWWVEVKTDDKNKRKHSAKHIPSYWRQTHLHRVCDFMYFTSALPVGLATSLLFWGLYAVDPRLVMPEWVEQMVPRWLNHVTHTAPIGFLLIDTLLTCHHAPSKTTGSLVVLLLFAIYLAIIGGVRLIDGYWLYPVFELYTPTVIAGLLAAAGVLFVLLYLIGDLFNSMLWGAAPHSEIPTGKTKAN
uniref:Androgen-induced gene 1 protein-like n=1 Tax=Steinernema glaseri TaxID=37863 RepID=A0A1I7ZHN4_9BILA